MKKHETRATSIVIEIPMAFLKVSIEHGLRAQVGKRLQKIALAVLKKKGLRKSAKMKAARCFCKAFDINTHCGFSANFHKFHIVYVCRCLEDSTGVYKHILDIALKTSLLFQSGNENLQLCTCM